MSQDNDLNNLDNLPQKPLEQSEQLERSEQLEQLGQLEQSGQLEQLEQLQSVGDVEISGNDNNVNVIQGTTVTVDQRRTQIIQQIAEDKDKAALNELLKSCSVKLSIPGQAGFSTGFFIAPGKILTCAQGIGSQPINVNWQEQKNFEATLSGLFPEPVGLAVLEFNAADSNHPCVYLDKAVKAVQPGDPLYTYGYSENFPKGGAVEGKCVGQTEESPKSITFTVDRTSPEISGSPLLNRQTGKVCGIVKSVGNFSQDVKGTAISTATILAKVNDLEKDQEKFHKKDRRWSQHLPLVRCKRRTVLFSSLGVAGLVAIVRFSGVLQPLELKFYDHLMQSQIPLASDSFLVVAADDQDITAQELRKEKVIGSLSNETLNQLLVRAEQLEPIAVGLDIYRDNVPLEGKADQALRNRFANDPKLFTVCKATFDSSEVAPPPSAAPNRVAFSDQVLDNDGILRRYTLAFDANDTKVENAIGTQSKCRTNFSLSLLLASQYLKQKKINLEPFDPQSEDCLRFKDSQGNYTVFPSFQYYTGGYQRVERYSGCQALINYHRKELVKYSSTNLKNAQIVTVRDFLNPEFPIDSYQQRVIFIGSLARNTLRDYWSTPYTTASGDLMPGVVIQAQMTSQILEAVLHNSVGRSMIWVLPQWKGIQWGEFLWMWMWTLGGGFLVWWWRSPKGSTIAIVSTCISGYIICFLVFQLKSGWFPLVPVIVAVGLTGLLVRWLNFRLRAEFSKPKSTP